MTRARKLTLSVKEFSHLVSESLDLAHVSPPPQSLIVTSPVVSETHKKNHSRTASFHRIFSRSPPTTGQRGGSSEAIPEDLPDTPRKMITWPFSRSPRKNRPAEDEDNIGTQDVKDPSAFPYPVTLATAASTSSLGSLVPAHERLFQVTSRDSDEPSRSAITFTVATSSASATGLPLADKPPTSSGRHPAAIPDQAIFGNGSTTSVCASSNRSMVEPASSNSNGTRTSYGGTETSHSVANTEPESVDEDPTPRVSTFGAQATPPSAEIPDHSLPVQRGRSLGPPLVVSAGNMDAMALCPAVGVLPHVPSETESTASACSASSPTSPVARNSSPTFPVMKPSSSGTSSPRVSPSTPPNPRVPAAFPDVFSAPNTESALASGFSPRQLKRALSRSMTPPPLPRPPPTGPLPAVPLSVPPVPPLPPLLNKISMNISATSSPRSVLPGAPANPTTALPPSPPGALRLPSRLSWVSSVRAVLPSPPASPTKSAKSLGSKVSHPSSPSTVEKKRSHELKRPTSVGIIEAADNIQVRRTKSILLLGSRSKSAASLGMKRVQIHADVDSGADVSRNPRRKSSAATVNHLPVRPESSLGLITPMPSSEILVLRERRHSAPLLSSSSNPRASADWTLSLPFCTDVPGNKIPLSPLLTPQLESGPVSEEPQGEDWTLCMPLKFRADTPTADVSSGGDRVCTRAETSETVESQTAMQLPTPSPSPTWSTPPPVACPLGPESMPTSEDRPVSPASLGPHVGGLDLAGGCGKRASGWHLYGWFDEVSILEDESHFASRVAADPDAKLVKSHVNVFRRTHDATGRHPSQESMSTVSTSGTTFYSVRSSLLVN